MLVENLCSLPLNPVAGETVAATIRGRPAILRHHDLSWQRPHLAHLGPPPTDPAWRQVCINARSKRELAARSIEADVFYNCFDPSPPPGDRGCGAVGSRTGRRRLVVLQPTRAIPRKNVAGGLRLAMGLGAVYWLLGPPEDGYDEELERLVEAARHKIRVLRGPAWPEATHCGRLRGVRSGDASFDLGGLRQSERRVGPLPPSSRDRTVPGRARRSGLSAFNGSRSTTPRPWPRGWPSPVRTCSTATRPSPGRISRWTTFPAGWRSGSRKAAASRFSRGDLSPRRLRFGLNAPARLLGSWRPNGRGPPSRHSPGPYGRAPRSRPALRPPS